MKKIFFAAALFFSCFAFQFADAQLRISLGLNIGSQPEWGPVGYNHAEYYYMPDIDAYYSVPTHQYIYFSNNQWIHANGLPPQYANYDLYHGYKVVVNQPNPWQRADYYRAHYANYRGHGGQQMIRDSRDARYQNHWHGDDRGRGNAYGHSYGQGQGNGNWHDRGQQGNGDHGQGNGNYGHGNGQPNNGNYNRGQGNGQPNNGQGQGNGNWHDNGHDHSHGGE